MKRFLAILLTAALLLIGLPTATSAEAVCFVAVNDTIPGALSDSTMPFYSGGVLYIPASTFDNTALGVVPAYNSSGQTLTLYNRDKQLVFDLSNGGATDERGVGTSYSAVVRDSTPFVPASFSAAHFGIGVSYLTSENGYSVVRLTTGSQVYDDGYFVQKAEKLIEARISQYYAVADSAASDPAEQTPAQTDETASTSSVSIPDESAEPSASSSPTPSTDPAEVCLLFTGVDGMEAALDALDAAGMDGAFFLTAEEISENPGLVRRIWAEGYALGTAVGEENSESALEQANDAFDKVLRTRSLLALAPDAETAQSLRTDGWCAFSAETPADSAALTETITAGGVKLLCFDSTVIVPAQLTAALKNLSAQVCPLHETTGLQ